MPEIALFSLPTFYVCGRDVPNYRQYLPDRYRRPGSFSAFFKARPISHSQQMRLDRCDSPLIAVAA